MVHFKGVPVTSMYQVTYNYPHPLCWPRRCSEVPVCLPQDQVGYAMYFGTYGRGIFMDTTHVIDHTNEIVTPDIYLDIPTVASNGDNSVRFYPNPAVDHATMELTVGKAGKAVCEDLRPHRQGGLYREPWQSGRRRPHPHHQLPNTPAWHVSCQCCRGWTESYL